LISKPGSRFAVYLQFAAKVRRKSSRFTGSPVRSSQFANYPHLRQASLDKKAKKEFESKLAKK